MSGRDVVGCKEVRRGRRTDDDGREEESLVRSLEVGFLDAEDEQAEN